jgi:hypothetical protein
LDDAKLTLEAVSMLSPNEVLKAASKWTGSETKLAAGIYRERDIDTPAESSEGRCRLLSHLLQAESPIEMLEPFIAHYSMAEVYEEVSNLVDLIPTATRGGLAMGIAGLAETKMNDGTMPIPAEETAKQVLGTFQLYLGQEWDLPQLTSNAIGCLSATDVINSLDLATGTFPRGRDRLLRHLLQTESPMATLRPFIGNYSWGEVFSSVAALTQVLEPEKARVLASETMKLDARYTTLADCLAFSDSGATGDMVADCSLLLQGPDGLKTALAMVADQGTSQIYESVKAVDGLCEIELTNIIEGYSEAIERILISESKLPKLYSHSASLSGTTRYGVDLEGAHPEVALLGRAQILLNQSVRADISEVEASKLETLAAALVRAAFKSIHQQVMNFVLKEISEEIRKRSKNHNPSAGGEKKVGVSQVGVVGCSMAC